MAFQHLGAYARLFYNPFLPRATIERMQIKKLRKLIAHCYHNVPYYREVMKERNLRPGDFTDIEDLKKLPIIDKRKVIESPSIFLARGSELEKPRKYVSSGSSGEIIVTCANRRHALLRDMVHTRGMLLAGVNVFRRQARIRPRAHISHKSKLIHRACMMKVKSISSLQDMDKIKAKLLSFRPQTLLAYPTFLDVFIEYLSSSERHEIGKFLRYVISRSGMLLRDVRERAESEFDAKVLDFYGCNEFGLLAFETGEHNGYYCNDDINILEILNDDPGQNSLKGEIAITSLYNYTMPLIRYNIKDSARFATDSLRPRLGFKILGEISGRSDDFIILPSGKRISPGTMGESLYGIPGVKGWQLIQNSLHRISLYLGISPPFLIQETRSLIESRLYKATGHKFELDIFYMDSLPREISEKCKRVKSELGKR